VGLFLFSLLYALNRAVSGTGRGGAAGWLIAAVLACLLGMGSKETMAATPVLAMAYDRSFLCASWKELFSKRGWVYGALALTWLWPLSRHLAYSPHLPEAGLPADAYWRYPLTQAWGVARMLWLAIWPHPLIFDYGPELVNRWQEVWAQGLLMILLLGATLWLVWRRPRIGYPALVFFALLAPSSSFIPIPGQPIAEHRMYTSLAAVIVLMVLGVEWIGRAAARKLRRPADSVLLAVVLLWGVLLGTASRARNAAYLDAGVLWEDTLKKRPGNSRACAATGRFLFAAGRHQEGLVRLQEAVRLRPDVAMNHNNLGNALAALGRSEAAKASFREALRIEPDLAEARFNLANLLSKAQRHDEALGHYRQAAEADPGNALFWYYTGMTQAQLGQFANAADAMGRVLSLQPDYPGAAQARQRIEEEIRRGP